MSAFVVTFLLAAAMTTMIWIAMGSRARTRAIEPPLPGQLSADERRRLYERLGIDPAALARQRHSHVIWVDPRIIDRRHTDA
jgi:hypothetical protein